MIVQETFLYGSGGVESRPLPERLRPDGPPQEFIDLWPKLTDQLIRLGLPEEELGHLGEDVETTMRAVLMWNEGKKIPGINEQFLPNTLRYHDAPHTIHVWEGLSRMLPGFVRGQMATGVDTATIQKNIRGVMIASLLHEIGYLKRAKGDEKYPSQAALYYDHVNRGIAFARDLIPTLHLHGGVGEEDLAFITSCIRGTDFNMPWNAKLAGEINEGAAPWAKLLEAADFLSAFAHEDNIPGLVSGLYWEHQAPFVMDGIVQVWDRDNTGAIRIDMKGKPMLRPANNPKEAREYYATIMEVKFGKPVRPEHPYEVPTQTLYEFVSSEFIIKFQEQMEPFLRLADSWYDVGEINLMRRNYRINRERIELLKAATREKKDDPFTVLEGGFTGHDLRQWMDTLGRRGLLPEGFQMSSSPLTIDARVLGMNPVENVFERLVTREIREILCRIPVARHPEAIAALLGQFREKMAGEEIGMVSMAVALGAYTKDSGGPYQNLEEALDIFARGFASLPEAEGLPRVTMTWTVRRDRDFGDIANPDGRSARMNALAELVNGAVRDNKINGIAFLGAEKDLLTAYQAFFNRVERRVPILMLVGQRFPEHRRDPSVAVEQKNVFLRNMAAIRDMLAPKFDNLALWGLQAVADCSPKEQEELLGGMPPRMTVVVTQTFDKLVGAVRDIARHPVYAMSRLKPAWEVVHATGNGAYAGFSSVRLDELTRASKG
ncbi:MAG: hypothetical protein Q8L37_05250 [Candidatus Gottesmanbacteria bacterium]|nr:hypothetical protein [Candidatus Gottesmanbacteria bacterium]